VTVLVTGATGFVGRHLVERLLADGVRVRAFVRPATVARHTLSAGVDLVSGDLATGALATGAPLDAAVQGCDVVYHLAAVHGPAVLAADCEAVNVRGTARLAEAAARAGVSRFVLASTRGVHGMIRDGTIDEGTPTSPDSPYRESKLVAEHEVSRVAGEHGLPSVILRLPSMIGSGAMGWLGLFRAVATGRFRMIGSGANRQHPCAVADAVQALSRVRIATGVDGETFVIGGKESVSTRAFISLIADTLGVGVSRIRLPAAPYEAWRAIELAAARLRGRRPSQGRNEFFVMSYRIDDSKARRLFGYEPSGSIADAVRETAAWYREHGHL
jgi:nucleoside-diphosphate-sugar epimerase